MYIKVYDMGHTDIELHLFVSFTLCQINATPMYWASRNGHHDVVQSLLGSGADVNIAVMPSVSDVMLMPME